MALINCEECGKEISDKAPACPFCGYQNDATPQSAAPAEDSTEQQSGKTDPFAIITFAAGIGGLLILPILFIPVGYICAIVSYYRMKEDKTLKGNGLRITGAILNSVNILYLLYMWGAL